MRNLCDVWTEAISAVDPKSLIPDGFLSASGEAVIGWGKASSRVFEVLDSQPLNRKRVLARLRIGLDDGNHPVPGCQSFRNGERLIEFFDYLRRRDIRKLRVFLSGGASSLAWLKPAELSEADVIAKVEALYRKPLTISELNAARSELCGLKAGGTADLLKRLAPRCKAEVEVISDVLPFGLDVVGSGPFYDGRVPHSSLADNRVLVNRLCELLGSHQKVLFSRSGFVASIEHWRRLVMKQVRIAKRKRKSGVLILGGEPLLEVLPSAGRGGRQTHLALSLIQELAPEIANGRVSVFAAASDGADGRSGSAGAYIALSRQTRFCRELSSEEMLKRMREALRAQNSAGFLKSKGALLPERPSNTNVQDVLIVQMNFQ